MSVEAITWALNDAAIPADRRDASSLAIVLVGLANHADPQGRNAFPAVATLVRYTRLSPRSVQYALRALEDLRLIARSDPDIVAAYLKRADRRPNGWDLAIHSSIHRVVHSRENGAQPVHPEPADGVQTRPDGVQTTTSRGARTAPEPSLNRPRNRPARRGSPRRVAAEAVGAVEPQGFRPPCGQCDARDTDPITARVIWLDADHTASARCPRCHPHIDPHIDTGPTSRNASTMTNIHRHPSDRTQPPTPTSPKKTRPSTTDDGRIRSSAPANASRSGPPAATTTSKGRR